MDNAKRQRCKSQRNIKSSHIFTCSLAREFPFFSFLSYRVKIQWWVATLEAMGGINMLRAHINFNKNYFLWKLHTEQIKIRINGFFLILQELFSEHSVFS